MSQLLINQGLGVERKLDILVSLLNIKLYVVWLVCNAIVTNRNFKPCALKKSNPNL